MKRPKYWMTDERVRALRALKPDQGHEESDSGDRKLNTGVKKIKCAGIFHALDTGGAYAVTIGNVPSRVL